MGSHNRLPLPLQASRSFDFIGLRWKLQINFSMDHIFVLEILEDGYYIGASRYSHRSLSLLDLKVLRICPCVIAPMPQSVQLPGSVDPAP